MKKDVVDKVRVGNLVLLLPSRNSLVVLPIVCGSNRKCKPALARQAGRKRGIYIRVVEPKATGGVAPKLCIMA